MKNKIVFIIIILSSLSFGQKEHERWEKSEDPYLIYHKDKNITESGGGILLKPFIFFYRFFISDQDGDNCPFYPSCSHFFLESVDETNLFQGTLMFSDRFTRDMNFIGRREKYPIIKNRRLYDPPGLYTLRKVIYPPSE